MNNASIERQKIFKKLILLGYNTDKKIQDMKIEDLILVHKLNRKELELSLSLKQALNEKRLVSFLCDSDLEKEK